MGRRSKKAAERFQHTTQHPDRNATSTTAIYVRPDLNAALCNPCISLIWEGLIQQPSEGNDQDEFRFELAYSLDRDSALRCQICSRAQAEFRKYSIDVAAIMDWSWYCIKTGDVSNRKKMRVHLGLRYRGLDYGWPAWKKPEDRTPESSTICLFNVWPTVHDAVDRMLQCLQLDPPRRPVVISWGHDTADDPPEEALPDMGIIKAWLDTCNANHMSCLPKARDQMPSWMPDRLVHCKLTDGQYQVRLLRKHVEADMFALHSLYADGRIPYIALSYCWGPPVNAQAPQGGRIVLTEDQLESWSQDIPVHVLGKTLVHALKMTIELGYRLIWIDSLCILQDSYEDWTTQSAHMSEIYQNADLVVAALSAKSVEHGLLQRSQVLPLWLQGRSNRASTAFQAKVLNNESFEREWRVSLVWDTSFSVWGRLWPLQSRAWAFQEYQMARRILAIHSAGYFCHCEEDSISSTLNQPDMIYGVLNKHIAQYGQKNSAIGATDVSESFDKIWQTVVTEYSRTSLTKQTDRLLAVSAVAKSLASQGGTGRYLAGLWEVHGCRGLTWALISDSPRAPRQHWGSDEYIAPSWSWLSISGSTASNHLAHPDRLDLCRLISHGTKSKTDFVFGQIEAGFLCIRGHLENLEWDETRMRTARPGRWRCLVSNVNVELFPDTTEDETVIKSDIAGIRWLPVASYIKDMGEIGLTGLLVLETNDSAYTTPFGKLDEGMKVYRRIGKCTGSIHMFEESYITLSDRIFEHADGILMEQFFSDIISQGIWDSDEWWDYAKRLRSRSRDTVDLILV